MLGSLPSFTQLRGSFNSLTCLSPSLPFDLHCPALLPNPQMSFVSFLLLVLMRTWHFSKQLLTI